MQDDNKKKLISGPSTEGLDIDKLKDDMLKGIYVLESALFSQAGFEFERIKNMRHLIDTVERDLFTDTTLNQLTPADKIKLYQLTVNNMTSSLNFLQTLHKNVESGLTTITQMEKISSERTKTKIEDTSNPDLDRLKVLIQEKIKQKLQEDSDK